MTVTLVDNEILGVYLLLKRDEPKLDKPLSGVLSKIERTLYSELSIDQLENIESLYRKGSIDPGSTAKR